MHPRDCLSTFDVTLAKKLVTTTYDAHERGQQAAAPTSNRTKPEPALGLATQPQPSTSSAPIRQAGWPQRRATPTSNWPARIAVPFTSTSTACVPGRGLRVV
jgi:hypothetical protein